MPIRSGSAKCTHTTSTRMGVLRKNSTNTIAGQRSARWLDIEARQRPSPATAAMIIDRMVSEKVTPAPLRKTQRYSQASAGIRLTSMTYARSVAFRQERVRGRDVLGVELVDLAARRGPGREIVEEARPVGIAVAYRPAVRRRRKLGAREGDAAPGGVFRHRQPPVERDLRQQSRIGVAAAHRVEDLDVGVDLQRQDLGLGEGAPRHLVLARSGDDGERAAV